jgi:preprotein translocase subunit SecG
MNVLFNLIVVLQIVSALAIIGLVLVQHGKGADMGAAFGSGASGSLFGASGSSNFLSKSTAVAAAIFFASTLGLAYFGGSRPHASVGGGVMERVKVPAGAPAAGVPATTVPATTVPATVPAAAAPAAPAAQSTQDVPGAAVPAPAPAPAPASTK